MSLITEEIFDAIGLNVLCFNRRTIKNWGRCHVEIKISEGERWREVCRMCVCVLVEGVQKKRGEEKAEDVTVVPFPGCLKSALKIGNSGVP